MTTLNDLRVCVTDAPQATLVAVGFGAQVDSVAQAYSKQHNVGVNILAPKDGFDLVAKMGPSGMRIDVGPSPPLRGAGWQMRPA